MKKNLCPILTSQLLALLLLGGVASPAFAATSQATASQEALRPAQAELSANWPRARHQNNQFFQSCKTNIDNRVIRGSFQSNDGNQGFNSGLNRDNSSNEGNQIFQLHRWGQKQNNQFFRTCGIKVDNRLFVGHHQFNDGNQGINHGVNEDNSSNEGNQISG